MKKLFLIFSAWTMIGMVSNAVAADAGYLYDWAETPDITSADDEFKAATDILSAWHATDGAYHYFRVDIQSAPGAGEYADIYGIYIDAHVGGNASSISYVPQGLLGIDYIVDSHFNPNMGGWSNNDFHSDWNGTIYETVSAPVAVQQTMNEGKTLEWKINMADIGSEFTWRAATHGIGDGFDTFDITTAATVTSEVPLPGGMLLLGSGLLAVSGIRKRRRV